MLRAARWRLVPARSAAPLSCAALTFEDQLTLGFVQGQAVVPAQDVARRRHRRLRAPDRRLDDHPQTRLKLRAYGKYVPEWLRVMASQASDVFVLDLFAGPGIYADGDTTAAGSPVIACDAALYVEERKREQGDSFRVHLRFVERDRDTLTLLQEVLGRYAGHLDYRAELGPASERAAALASESSGHPTLVLLDPDGYRDVPFDLVRQFGWRKFTEVLISFDVQGYMRAAGLPEAKSLSAFFGDDLWRRDRRGDGTIDADQFLESYRRRLARDRMFPRTTIKRIVFSEAHANRAIAQCCWSELAVKLWRSCFAEASESSGGLMLDIIRELDRRQRLDGAMALIQELSGARDILYGAIRQLLDQPGMDLDEDDVHQALLFLRDHGFVLWTSRLHKQARPAPRFSFGEIPEGLRWDGRVRTRERPLPMLTRQESGRP